MNWQAIPKRFGAPLREIPQSVLSDR